MAPAVSPAAQEAGAKARRFHAAPNIIFSLIRAQAGTLAKALLEAAMNSADAGASRVDFTLHADRLSIQDNGKGFATMESIEECFEVFGFEHQEGDRQYGQFGIGRAQLWNWCATHWRTHTFSMDVDIKRKGLDYDLRDGLPPVKGLLIEGTMYEPMSARDLMTAERELKELCAFASIEIALNGKLLNKEPSKLEWTHETDDAWIKLDTSTTFAVYNMGMKVRDYSSYHFGCGGILVTKPNVRLALNMARNDILQSQCVVWKRIRPFLQKKSDETRVRTREKLTEAQAKNLALRLLSGEGSWLDLRGERLLKKVGGQSFSLTQLAHISAGWSGSARFVMLAPPHTQSACEAIARLGNVLVLSTETGVRFGVSSARELQQALATVLLRDEPKGHNAFAEGKTKAKWLTEAEAQEMVDRQSSSYTPVPRAKLEKELQGALSLIQRDQRILTAALTAAGLDIKHRVICVGASSEALAWTDSSSQITLDVEFLRGCMRSGLAGVTRLTHVLVHEYLHDAATDSAHGHEPEFYEAYHDVLTHEGAAVHLLNFALRVYQGYVGVLARCGKRVPLKLTSAADALKLTVLGEHALKEADTLLAQLPASDEAALASGTPQEQQAPGEPLRQAALKR